MRLDDLGVGFELNNKERRKANQDRIKSTAETCHDVLCVAGGFTVTALVLAGVSYSCFFIGQR